MGTGTVVSGDLSQDELIALFFLNLIKNNFDVLIPKRKHIFDVMDSH